MARLSSFEVFRGALDVRVRTITYEMGQAAAQVWWGDAFDFRVPPPP